MTIQDYAMDTTSTHDFDATGDRHFDDYVVGLKSVGLVDLAAQVRDLATTPREAALVNELLDRLSGLMSPSMMLGALLDVLGTDRHWGSLDSRHSGFEFTDLQHRIAY